MNTHAPSQLKGSKMKTKQAHYWEAQEQRWYEQYLAGEKLLNEMETVLRAVETLALDNITDEIVRAKIVKLVDDVWRGAR
jgi:hypothetical protein